MTIDPASGGGAGTGRLDAHVHFWRYDPADYAWIDDRMVTLRRDFTPDVAWPLLQAAGVGSCVAVQARQTPDENRWLLGLADRYPWIAGVVGWVDLMSPDVERQLEAAAAHPRLVGVRHVIQDEPAGFMRREDFRRWLAAVARAGLAYDILIRAPQLAEAVELAAAFPEHRFVLDHLGKPDIQGDGFAAWEGPLRRLAELPNVCAKLSGLVTEADWHGWTAAQLRPYLDLAIACFGAERLMFGSDWPVCTLAAPYAGVVAVVEGVLDGRSSLERARIFGGTARAFWRLRSDA